MSISNYFALFKCQLERLDSSDSETLLRLSLFKSNAPAELTSHLCEFIQNLLGSPGSIPVGKSIVTRLSQKINGSDNSLALYAQRGHYSSLKDDYIFVFLQTDIELLESFQPDIDLYCSNFDRLLADSENTTLDRELEYWYANSIEYLPRAIKILSKMGILNALLYMALCNRTVVFDTEEGQLKCDIEKLFELCCTGNALLKSLSNQSTSECGANVGIEIGRVKNEPIVFVTFTTGSDAADTSPSMSETKSNAFCDKWAEVLCRSADASMHSVARNLTNAFRLKVIQDSVNLKRLLNAAEIDHYALYKTYEFLVRSQNADILLYLAHKNAILNNHVEHIKIIELLTEYVDNE